MLDGKGGSTIFDLWKYNKVFILCLPSSLQLTTKSNFPVYVGLPWLSNL